jgi:hypothetical protein
MGAENLIYANAVMLNLPTKDFLIMIRSSGIVRIVLPLTFSIDSVASSLIYTNLKANSISSLQNQGCGCWIALSLHYFSVLKFRRKLIDSSLQI